MTNRKSVIWSAAAALLLSLCFSGARALAQDQKPADVTTKKVTLNLENADLRYALKLLFTSAGVNYTLDQAVQGTVTVSLTDVQFRTALESVLRSTASQSPLTYRVEDMVYIITLKVEQVVDTGGKEDENEKPQPKSRIQKRNRSSGSVIQHCFLSLQMADFLSLVFA